MITKIKSVAENIMTSPWPYRILRLSLAAMFIYGGVIKLIDPKSFALPATVAGLMCRHQISIDWDGTMYDCDFNLALGMMVNHGAPDRIEDFDSDLLRDRRIVTGIHCFGCTAGTGSSCSGALLSCSQENPEKKKSLT
jgi:hypothetical protein